VPFPPPKRLSHAELAALARFLMKTGLGPLRSSRQPCHGYANGCTCEECKDRNRQIHERGFTPDGEIAPPPEPPQPWTGNS
jgi:hypothetical protein